MPVDIYDDEGSPFAAALKQVLTTIGKDVNVALVNINMKPAEHALRTEMSGLCLAYEKLSPRKQPIILYSFLPESRLIHELEFVALMGCRRVGFLRLPFNMTDVFELYGKLLNDTKEEDSVAIALGKQARYHRTMGMLKHDLKPTISRAQEAVIIKKTREEAGLTGTDAEIVIAILNYREGKYRGIFSGKYWPGVFCDIGGTLTKALPLLKKYNKEGRPITLWTGGDVAEHRKEVFKQGITWKVLSKYDFASATVEIAIDDEPESELKRKYKIAAKKFIKV